MIVLFLKHKKKIKPFLKKTKKDDSIIMQFRKQMKRFSHTVKLHSEKVKEMTNSVNN